MAFGRYLKLLSKNRATDEHGMNLVRKHVKFWGRGADGNPCLKPVPECVRILWESTQFEIASEILQSPDDKGIFEFFKSLSLFL